MSFSSLPEELVDLVALEVRDSGTSTSCSFALMSDLSDSLFQSGSPNDLAKLCLVSRQTLHSARRALYENPYAQERKFDEIGFPVAKQLLTSLQANHNQLGRLVRSTRDLYLSVTLWGSTKHNGEMEEEEGLSAKIIETWYLETSFVLARISEKSISSSGQIDYSTYRLKL